MILLFNFQQQFFHCATDFFRGKALDRRKGPHWHEHRARDVPVPCMEGAGPRLAPGVDVVDFDTESVHFLDYLTNGAPYAKAPPGGRPL